MPSSIATTLESNEELDLCIQCSLNKARNCRWATLNQIAQMGTDKIYQYEPCGISFCVRSDTDKSETDVIACVDLS